VLDVCFAGDAHSGDFRSPVGAQGWNINKQVPGVQPGSPVRFSFGGSWNTLPDLLHRVFPFGTLLGPEATGPGVLPLFLRGWGGARGSGCFCLFLRRPEAVTVNTWAVDGCDGVVV